MFRNQKNYTDNIFQCSNCPPPPKVQPIPSKMNSTRHKISLKRVKSTKPKEEKVCKTQRHAAVVNALPALNTSFIQRGSEIHFSFENQLPYQRAYIIQEPIKINPVTERQAEKAINSTT